MSSEGPSKDLAPGAASWSADTLGHKTPPPGFVATPGLWSDNNTNAGTAATEGSTTASSNGGQPRQRNERTSSFNNIAAALGNGLAESMDDATRGEHLMKSNHGNGDVPSTLTDNFFNPSNTNEMRHRRHAAILGAAASTSSESKTSANAGSLFGVTGNDNNTSSIVGRTIGGGSSALSSPFAQDPNAPSFTPSAISSLNDNGQSKLGMTVMEPSDSSFSGSSISTRNFSQYGAGRIGTSGTDISHGIQVDMQKLNLWSGSDGNRPGDSRNLGSTPSNNLGGRLGSPSTTVDAENELIPFTWDTNYHEQSRTLAVFNASSIHPNEIISICETFGGVETYRSEFLEALGVAFISFSDMRSAQFAAVQLPMRLQRAPGGSPRVQVKFCIPLNSSTQNDESLVVVNDLPHQISAEDLGRMLSNFGAIRSLKNLAGGNYGGSFVAEFHDIEDARKVVFELESTQRLGPDVIIEVGARNPADRKKGREFNAMLGRWRNQTGAGQGGTPNRGGRQGGRTPDSYRSHDSRGMGHNDGRYDRGYSQNDRSPHQGYGSGPQDGRYSYGGNSYGMNQPHHGYNQYRGHPNDNGGYGGHGHHGNYMNRQGNHHPPPHQQHYYQQPQQSHSNYTGGSSVVSGTSSRHTGASGYYTDDRSIGSHNSNLRSVGSLADSMAGNTRDNQREHLILDLEAVENGLDTRTSLMVRNIPNKYTQKMLLEEFTEHKHGPGVIDFFYLPIDFKNRCNRGYAFINFVDYHDILKFHRQYFGQHWRTFNSDKICDITYARIQGKAAMLKRFENSALMEKDEEYKPLVFVSSGPERGKRLPFPDS